MLNRGVEIIRKASSHSGQIILQQAPKILLTRY